MSDMCRIHWYSLYADHADQPCAYNVVLHIHAQNCYINICAPLKCIAETGNFQKTNQTMWLSTRKGTISQQKCFFSDYTGYSIHSSVRVFAANLGHIAHFIAEIQLTRSSKSNDRQNGNFCTPNIFLYTHLLQLRVFWPMPPWLCSDHTMSRWPRGKLRGLFVS